MKNQNDKLDRGISEDGDMYTGRMLVNLSMLEASLIMMPVTRQCLMKCIDSHLEGEIKRVNTRVNSRFA
jgi:hypothetical protein